MSSFSRHSIAGTALLTSVALTLSISGAGCANGKPPKDASPNGAPGAGDGSAGSDPTHWHQLAGNDAGAQHGSGGTHAGDAGKKPSGDAASEADGGAPPSVRVDPESIHASDTWPVCRLLAPNDKGVGGTDLGFSVPAPIDPNVAPGDERLIFMFGDTWAQPMADCRYTRETSDDLQATMPARRSALLGAGAPTPEAAAACDDLSYAFDKADDTSSWRAIRLYTDAGERSDDKIVDTTFLRTPVTGFSDGEHTYVVLLRNDPAYCDTSAGCPSGAYCSTEAAQHAPSHAEIGTCTSSSSPTSNADSPAFCLRPSSCSGGGVCNALTRGICLAETPYTLPGADGPLSPPWFDEDPRRAILRSMYLAAAVWPERPEDYAIGYTFASRKFFNGVARTVAHFDPRDPGANDYRPGTETLLLWGRPAFFSSGGAQAGLFLLYQPLDGLLDADGKLNWKPQFFAGYDDDTGLPRWSDSEGDAQPVYGGALEVVDGKTQVSTDDTEFDLVNHDAMTWVESLQRWLLLYGGSVPDWIRADAASGEVPAITYEQPAPGQLHIRTAAHPWGRATRESPAEEAWTLPKPLAGPESASSLLACELPGALPDTGCAIPRDANAILSDIVDWAMVAAPQAWQDATATCVAGNAAFSALYSLQGGDQPHLYGVNIIDAWTEDVTSQVTDLGADERAVELYWNVSTWAPYEVVLMKSQLRARVLE